MNNKYVAITEVRTVEPYVEPKEYSQEELLKIIKQTEFIPLCFDKPIEVLKSYLKIEISEETFNFINDVAIISSPIFGEKEYKINDLSFKIYTKEDYEKIYGN